MNTGWFVLYCNVRAEKKAEEKLAGQGFTVYRPVYVQERKKHRNSRERVPIEMNLLPRYLFVREFPLEDHLSWFMIRKTEGVESALLVNGMPAKVAGFVVDELRQAQQDGAFDDRVPDPTVFKAGQRVRMVEGAFSGHMATIQRVMSSGSAKVLMTLFGSTRHVRVPIDALRLAS
jgi:transcription antitermination factor NusG